MERTQKRTWDVLILSLVPFPSATRARKAALAYARSGLHVKFVGLAAAGRSGTRAKSGVSTLDDISVQHVPIARLATAPHPIAHLRNVAMAYGPSVLRMLATAMTTSATRVHVVSSPLALLGVIHKIRNSSEFVLDVTERPGQVSTQGSLASLFSRVEQPMLRSVSRWVDQALAVVDPDVNYLRSVGFKQVHLVRNAPMTDWRAMYSAPLLQGPTIFVFTGSIFEGRGYEMLIDATALAARRAAIQVNICGPGREAYIATLQRRAREADVDKTIRWMGPVSPQEVSKQYIDGHVGLVLYESHDPGNDGLPNKLFECVSTGRPVLAGSLPQVRDFVEQTRTGWLTTMTAEGLAEVMVEVANTPKEDMVTLAELCRSIGDQWLSWEAEFKPLLENDGWA